MIKQLSKIFVDKKLLADNTLKEKVVHNTDKNSNTETIHDLNRLL